MNNNNDKIKAIVSYIIFICAIIFLVQKDSSRNLKFHAAQAIVIAVAYFIISFAFGFIAGLTGIGLFTILPYVFYILFMVLGIVKANGESDPELPVIGNITKSIFGKMIEG